MLSENWRLTSLGVRNLRYRNFCALRGALWLPIDFSSPRQILMNLRTAKNDLTGRPSLCRRRARRIACSPLSKQLLALALLSLLRRNEGPSQRKKSLRLRNGATETDNA